MACSRACCVSKLFCTIFDHALPQDSFSEFIISGKTCIFVLELERVRRNASYVLNYNGNDDFKPSRYPKVESCITPSILLRHWAVAEQRPTFPALPHGGRCCFLQHFDS